MPPKRARRRSMMDAMDDVFAAAATEKKLKEKHVHQADTSGNKEHVAGTDYYVGDPIWVTHSKEAWIPATITGIVDETSVRVLAEDKRHDRNERVATFHTAEAEATLSKSGGGGGGGSGGGGGGRRNQKEITYMLPRDHRMQNELGVENMDDMVHLHEAAVLDNLRKRFERDLIYTSTGPILIAMNPFKRLPIYANELMQATHAKLMSETPCEPHVFTTVGESYIAMRETGENQSMVICGESGAGKTETTKLMLRYLSRTASAVSGSGEIEEQILESNPVREYIQTNLFVFLFF